MLYCCVGSITREFPLSADVIVASFSTSFVCMDRRVLCLRRVVGLVLSLVFVVEFYHMIGKLFPLVVIVCRG